VKDGTFYTGMTDNLERRIEEHNAGIMKYTSGHGSWILVHSESCLSRTEARAREKYWKSGIGREERDAKLK